MPYVRGMISQGCMTIRTANPLATAPNVRLTMCNQASNRVQSANFADFASRYDRASAGRSPQMRGHLCASARDHIDTVTR